MNKFIKRSLLAAALFSPMAMAAVDTNVDTCNASEGLEGWAVWCGVDTFLAQQEPTAAGPVVGGSDLASLAVDDEGFGGEIVPVVPPVVPPVPEIEYNWQGYAVIKHRDFHDPISGKAQLNIDPETGSVVGVLTTSTGDTININRDASFVYRDIKTFADGTEATVFDMGAAYSAFEVYSEDNNLQLSLSNFDNFGVNGMESYAKTVIWLNEQTEAGYTPLVARYAGGLLTPLSDMQELARLNVTADYAGRGGHYTYTGAGVFYPHLTTNMNVNFGNATWTGNWNADHFNVGASGVVTGNQFSSNSITNGLPAPARLAPVAVTGTINGAFNGANAGYVSGALDIDNGTRYVGVFNGTRVDVD